IEDADRAGNGIAGQPWTSLLGPPGGRGHAAAVSPAITPQIPWQAFLPGTDRLDGGLVGRLMERTGRPPVWQAVTDGKLLFVSTPAGIVARDLATFDFVWQSIPSGPARSPDIDRQRIIMN